MAELNCVELTGLGGSLVKVVEGYHATMSKLTNEQLVDLVRQIANSSACMMDFDALVSKLEQNVPHPNASVLIFDPPGGKVLPPEKIVQIALEWKRAEQQ